MEARTQAKAVLRYARISPRKVKIVNDLIRNKNVAEASLVDGIDIVPAQNLKEAAVKCSIPKAK